MRPFQHTIPIDEARAILHAAARPLARVERVALEALAQRVLAEDVTAEADVPPFARAMMDGYAVQAGDTTGASRDTPRELSLAGRVFTGEVFPTALGPGACIEIATGAPLPAGADAVVMVEETQPAATGRVAILGAVAPGQHVGRAGADIARGTTVLRTGDLLLPSRVGVLAALGRTSATVVARPRVAIVSTGNEVVAPGRALGPGQIHDINRHTLSAVVAAHGGVPEPLEVAGDTLEALDQAVDAALGVRRDRVLRRQLGRRSRPRARRPAPARRGGVPRHRDAARQAHRVRSPRHGAGLRHARQPDVVSHQRLCAAGAVPAACGAVAAAPAARGVGAAGPPGGLGRGPAPVLHGAGRGRPRRAGVQGHRATSRAWRTPTATSRSRPMSPSSTPARW